MERGATEYSQSGLHTPYPHAFTDAKSEDSPADHASAALYSNTSQPEVRAANYAASATPTSEYGVYPTSARSGTFPEHIQRQYHPGSNHSGSSGGMAQPTSPSLPLQDSRSNHNPQIKSDQDVPIDPSIAASSPTYPAQHGQYSPYPPQEQMQHGYPSHPGSAMYDQPRPQWSTYGAHPQHGIPGYPVTGAQTPTSAAPAGARPGQVGASSLVNSSSPDFRDVTGSPSVAPPYPETPQNLSRRVSSTPHERGGNNTLAIARDWRLLASEPPLGMHVLHQVNSVRANEEHWHFPCTAGRV